MAESFAKRKNDRKRSKRYFPPKKRSGHIKHLSTGMSGVLVTTNDWEELCTSEASDLFNEYADKLYGDEFPEAEQQGEEEDEDIDEAFASEVKKLKGDGLKERRFQVVQSGVKNVIFIQCRSPVDPCELAHTILSDIRKTGVQKARYCQRLTPVTVICRANMEDIASHAKPLLLPFFHNSTDPIPIHFSVAFKSRNNNVLKRDSVIQLLASLVTNEGAYPHIVNLKNPELVVSVGVIKGLCCLSVLKDYVRLKQYNLQALCDTAPVTTPPTTADSSDVAMSLTTPPTSAIAVSDQASHETSADTSPGTDEKLAEVKESVTSSIGSSDTDKEQVLTQTDTS